MVARNGYMMNWWGSICESITLKPREYHGVSNHRQLINQLDQANINEKIAVPRHWC